MAVKSVIDIDLRDEKFQQFTQRWEKYQQALAKLPDAWAGVAKEQGKGASELERMTAALLAHNELLHEGKDADEKRLKQLTTSERLWTSMSKSAGSMSKSVLDISGKLLGWTGLIAGGLLGGSLFGIDRMASSVSNSRRSAMGLGLSIGEQKAFGINFERLMDPNFLAQVAEMRTDPSKAGPLYTMGVGTSGTTESTAVALVKAMYAKAHATPEGMLGQLDNMTGMSVGFEQWYRLQRMGRPEFNSLIAGNRRDIGALGISEGTASGWQAFTTQMDRAGASIFKTFVQGLAPLSGPLTGLSTSLTHLVQTLLPSTGNGPLQKSIEGLGHWIDGLSGKLGSQSFLTSVDTFVSATGQLADAMKAVQDAVAHPGAAIAKGVVGAVKADFTSGHMAVWDGLKYAGSLVGDAGKWIAGQVSGAHLASIDKQYGLPANLLEQMKKAESGNSMNPAMSKAGAIGIFQFMPATAAQYGINPADPMQSANGAARYMADLEAKYKGDLAKSLAAYNWGPANLDKDISAHGKDWMRFAPKETQDYVRKVGGINVVVSNNTGGSATVSVNSLQAGP